MDNTMTMLLIVLGIFLTMGMITMIYCLYILAIKSKNLQPITIPVLNFEQDILFLNYIIESKLRDAKDFNLSPLRFARSTFTKEEDLEEIRDMTIISIYEYLSPSYKKTLSKYFTEEGIVTYITEKVFKELTLNTIESNLKSLK